LKAKESVSDPNEIISNVNN